MIRALALALAALVTLAPAPAAAEWFLDLYGGQSWTRDTDIEIQGLDISGVPVDVELLDVKLDDSLLLGVRFGHWFGFAPFFGLAVDAFYFRPDVASQRVQATGTVRAEIFDELIEATAAGPVRIPDADVPAVVIALDVMLRLPLLRDERFPNGRLQPYVTAGPAGLITDPEDLGASVGVKAGAGLVFQIFRHLAVFGEYRFTHFSPEVESGGIEYSADIDTHHALVGISLRF